tara:strand:+ start:139 stop:459 length:321 start_codon:yes stop_codon:yes gene_type:complete
MCQYASHGSDTPKHRKATGESNKGFSANFDKAIKLIEETQSPQHFVDSLKHKIISYKNFNETYESLRPLCVLELFWLVERIEVEQIYIDAAEKDEQHKQALISAAR